MSVDIPPSPDCLAKQPPLEGQLHFRLQLATDGDVLNVAAVVNTLGDAEALSGA